MLTGIFLFVGFVLSVTHRHRRYCASWDIHTSDVGQLEKPRLPWVVVYMSPCAASLAWIAAQPLEMSVKKKKTRAGWVAVGQSGVKRH